MSAATLQAWVTLLLPQLLPCSSPVGGQLPGWEGL